MKTTDFFFDLPEELIAKYPPPERGKSRLLLLDRCTGKRQHCMAENLPEILAGPEFPGSGGQAPLLVFNNSRVRKARLKAELKTGLKSGDSGTAEFLLIKRVDSFTWQCMVNRSKRRRIGQRYCFEAGLEGEIIDLPPDTGTQNAADTNGLLYLRFDTPIDENWLDIHGHIPLPPYIKRDDEEEDSNRYQTIYASREAGAGLGPGASAAAPTAGLHFTEDLFARLEAAEIEKVFITLHVGLGTFLPVRTENIEDHVMHEEAYSISEEAAQKINAAKAAGRKIIAVGTTSLRTLESACIENSAENEKGLYVKAGEGSTSIFIYPGYCFKIADALFTNFHTPGSTLLMLVSAFAGQQCIMDSYSEAIRKRYRFFSYGDAMLIW